MTAFLKIQAKEMGVSSALERSTVYGRERLHTLAEDDLYWDGPQSFVSK